MEVEASQVSQYGCAAIKPTGEDDVVEVTDLVEKPVPAEAPSNWIVIGRYVCDPAVFGVLRQTPPGRGGEIQLTDALRTLAVADHGAGAGGGGVHGVLFRGRRYDTGNKLDYLRTQIQFACEREAIAPEFVPWLRNYLDHLPGRSPGGGIGGASAPGQPRGAMGGAGPPASHHPQARRPCSPWTATSPRCSRPSARCRRASSAWRKLTAGCWRGTSPRPGRCRRSTTRPWTVTRSSPPTSPRRHRSIRSHCRSSVRWRPATPAAGTWPRERASGS